MEHRAWGMESLLASHYAFEAIKYSTGMRNEKCEMINYLLSAAI